MNNATIWKAEVEIDNFQNVVMPAGSKVLSIANQFGQTCIWFAVPDTKAEKVNVTIRMIGTGHSVGDDEFDNMSFIGTVMKGGGARVYHAFVVHS